MYISINLLDFNKENSSKSLLNDLIPNSDDEKTLKELHYKHEDFIEEKQEDNDEFSYADLWFEHVSRFLETPPSEDEFKKALENCDIFNGGIDVISLNKINNDSFEFLLKLFFACDSSYNSIKYLNNDSVIFLNEEFKNCDAVQFRKLINERKSKKLPVMLSVLLYWA